MLQLPHDDDALWPDLSKKLSSLHLLSQQRDIGRDAIIREFGNLVKWNLERQGQESNSIDLMNEVLNEEEFGDCMGHIVSEIISYASRLPELFPDGIQMLSSIKSSLDLSRAQIRSLLSHALLCSIKTPSWNARGLELTFRQWFYKEEPLDVAKRLYLRSFFRYFKQDCTEDELVTFGLHDLNDEVDWESSPTLLSTATVEVLESGVIGDYQPDTSEEEEVTMVDFANAEPGFGPGFTQEELLLGTRPETYPIALLCSEMGRNDGGLSDTQVATTSGGGCPQYGFFHFDQDGELVDQGPPTAEQTKKFNATNIVAMDALPFTADSSYERRRDQLDRENLLRELNKAYCGFANRSEGKRRRVFETGHWGCGAFGGDREIKLLLQLMAAAQAGVDKVVFYCVGDDASEFAASIRSFLQILEDKKASVGQMFRLLTQVRKDLFTVENAAMLSFTMRFDDSRFLFDHLIDKL